MPRQVFDFDPPDRFVAGTVGPPGQRTFFLQATAAGRITSVALEKQQVAALAERVDELLDEVVRRSGGTAAVPALASTQTEDMAPLNVPIEEEFRVGTMSLAWDGETERVVIECFDADGDDDADTDDDVPGPLDDTDPDVDRGADDRGADPREVPPELAALAAELPDAEVVEELQAVDARSVLRVCMTGAVARAFARRALAVVASGRPPCPFCAGPLDADGHICPRANGYKR